MRSLGSALSCFEVFGFGKENHWSLPCCLSACISDKTFPIFIAMPYRVEGFDGGMGRSLQRWERVCGVGCVRSAQL